MSSWITGLADRAENILNKIDQNAATALQIEPNSLDSMKKSLTSSTQSLKSSFSPAKRASTSMSMSTSIGGNSASSANSEYGGVGQLETMEMRKTLPTSASFSTSLGTFTNNMDTQELAAFKIALNEITAERDELHQRLGEMNQDTENFSLKQHVQELEVLSQSLSQERDKAVQELNEAQTAGLAYVHSISELETNLAKLQQEYLNTAHKLQMQTKETEQQRLELQEYRAKAQRALQAKDTLIAELKGNPIEQGTQLTAKDSETRFLQIEHDALKQELHHSNEEQQKLRLQMENYMELERQRELELSTARHREETLTKELRSVREHNLTTESEQRVLTQELNSLRQQLSNHMAASATRLQEKEQQLQQLRQQQNIRLSIDGFNTDKNDYEKRLKALTESLVERQSTLERITAERNALRLQYEKTQMQLQQSIHLNELESQRGGARNALLSNSTDDAKSQFPLLMHPSPFDNRVARRVKRAYSSLDSAGIRLGAFLRRYPLMRISVIMYVALLHLWVMFVLLSTTPN
ncbi:golgin-84 [Scaptodrosophila lebanonensis]|uniref:Golgin-84 n=1 Tax=Drosophila lebanonensis TaxID=7225 RepID=A0A6J2TIU9_DROLE|nr:golgin-84 [Scaptodrosophila lebanonensis]